MICYRVTAAANLKNVVLRKTRLKMKFDRARTITQVQIFKRNYQAQNDMLQRVNVNSHSIVRIDVKTQNGRKFAKKNRR